MTPLNLLNALEAWMCEEIAGKQRLVRGLEGQERALVSGSPDEIESATRQVEAELAAEIERSRRREAIFARLAAHWNVAASALTISSIAERAAPAGQRIRELRGELRTLAAAAVSRNRRIARLVHVHQGIARDTLAALVGSAGQDSETGAFFDARM